MTQDLGYADKGAAETPTQIKHTSKCLLADNCGFRNADHKTVSQSKIR